MSPELLRVLLERVKLGELSVSQAEEQLARLPFADLGFARVDHHRQLRQGIPEVIFAEGKRPEHIVAISQEVIAQGQTLFITRLSAEAASALQLGLVGETISYNAVARTATWLGPHVVERPNARVVIVTAGTSDLPVAEEIRETLGASGVKAESLNDVGVAGLHRLLSEIDTLRQAEVIIVAAGMEGALASVVGGLVQVPVIAVPTSVGYGAAFGGLAALLGMLTSCAAGVTTVNIDNGFGAAMAALRIVDTRVSASSGEMA